MLSMISRPVSLKVITGDDRYHKMTQIGIRKYLINKNLVVYIHITLKYGL